MEFKGQTRKKREQGGEGRNIGETSEAKGCLREHGSPLQWKIPKIYTYMEVI